MYEFRIYDTENSYHRRQDFLMTSSTKVNRNDGIVLLINGAINNVLAHETCICCEK